MEAILMSLLLRWGDDYTPSALFFKPSSHGGVPYLLLLLGLWKVQVHSEKHCDFDLTTHTMEAQAI